MLYSPRWPAWLGRAGDDGRAAFERFVTGLHRNMPVSGTFTINKRQPLDPAVRERFTKEQPSGVLTPDESTVRCRWAIDRTREVCEPLDSPHITNYSRFFIGPDGAVEGINAHQYTLRKVRRVVSCRPANFNFLHSGCERWETLLSDPNYRFELADGANGRSIWAKDDKRKNAVRIDLAADGSLASAAGLYDGKQLWSLEVAEYQLSPKGDKRFPKRATTRMVDPDKGGKLLASEELVAEQISFPDPGPATDALFELSVPKGVVVGIEGLKQAITPESATQAAALVAHPLDFPRKVAKPAGPSAGLPEELPGAGPPATQSTAEAAPNGWLRWVWGGVGITAGLTVLATIVRLARLRARQP